MRTSCEDVDVEEGLVRDLLAPGDDPAVVAKSDEVAWLQEADVFAAEDLEEGALVDVLLKR